MLSLLNVFLNSLEPNPKKREHKESKVKPEERLAKQQGFPETGAVPTNEALSCTSYVKPSFV